MPKFLKKIKDFLKSLVSYITNNQIVKIAFITITTIITLSCSYILYYRSKYGVRMATNSFCDPKVIETMEKTIDLYNRCQFNENLELVEREKNLQLKLIHRKINTKKDLCNKIDNDSIDLSAIDIPTNLIPEKTLDLSPEKKKDIYLLMTKDISDEEMQQKKEFTIGISKDMGELGLAALNRVFDQKITNNVNKYYEDFVAREVKALGYEIKDKDIKIEKYNPKEVNISSYDYILYISDKTPYVVFFNDDENPRICFEDEKLSENMKYTQLPDRVGLIECSPFVMKESGKIDYILFKSLYDMIYHNIKIDVLSLESSDVPNVTEIENQNNPNIINTSPTPSESILQSSHNDEKYDSTKTSEEFVRENKKINQNLRKAMNDVVKQTNMMTRANKFLIKEMQEETEKALRS